MNCLAPFVSEQDASTSAPTVTRPVLRYHGGKWRLAPWVLTHFPAHRVYVEPFGGAASVLLRKPRSYAEVYNDLDEEVVGLFEVLRNRVDAAELRRVVELTPYARVEFERSYQPCEDRIERARRLLVRSWMAHGSSGLRGHKTGFRLGSMREYSTAAGDWRNYPKSLTALVERLQGVVIERRPATDVIAREDRPDTLIYADPPYMFATRSQKRIGSDLYHGYRHELDDAAHVALLEQLRAVRAMVVLSGYPSPVYDTMLADWRRVERAAQADRGEPRTEVLWINPQADAALSHGPLFVTSPQTANTPSRPFRTSNPGDV